MRMKTYCGAEEATSDLWGKKGYGVEDAMGDLEIPAALNDWGIWKCLRCD